MVPRALCLLHVSWLSTTCADARSWRVAGTLHYQPAYLLRGAVVRIGFASDQLGFALRNVSKTGLLIGDTSRKTFPRATRAETAVGA